MLARRPSGSDGVSPRLNCTVTHLMEQPLFDSPITDIYREIIESNVAHTGRYFPGETIPDILISPSYLPANHWEH